MPTEKTEKRPGADLDAWCWQLQALEDVTQFVRRHGPTSASPLPIVPWRLGHSRNAVAELHSWDEDALDVLRAFAKVLGAKVQERHLDDRITYFVTGQVGRKDGPQLLPRTRLSVYATKYRPLPGEDGDAS